MIKVVIVDDDIQAAHALKRNINGEKEIVVMGVFGSGRDVVRYCKKETPDIILMDIRMPEMDGIEASQLIKCNKPQIKILILTLFTEKENFLHAIESNCEGFLYKSHKSEEIVATITSVYNGLNTYESGVNEVFNEGIYELDAQRQANTESMHDLEKLAEREQNIVKLITGGKKDTEIAEALFVSEGHLRNSLVEIRKKLNFRNSRELAAWGAKVGL